MSYTGWKLPEAERASLLQMIHPAYPDVIAHHITCVFPAPTGATPPVETNGEIVGFADDGSGVQALVVKIGGTIRRPDGAIYHITWSIDRAAGRKPVHSNTVIAKQWTPFVLSIPVKLIPAIF